MSTDWVQHHKMADVHKDMLRWGLHGATCFW